MNLNLHEGKQLLEEILSELKSSDVSVLIFPPAPFIDALAKVSRPISVGAQNVNQNEAGAYTGECSISQLQSVGATVALIGHSERRALFGETNETLKQKVDAAITHDFEFIFCCGEPLDIRENGSEFHYVKRQLEESLFHLSAAQIQNGIIAYEPVWAIGTGKTATTEQAGEMHAHIRSWLEETYSLEVAQSISILYGGSCNEKNAAELFACPNVDGGLIGGASLKAESFLHIIHAR